LVFLFFVEIVEGLRHRLTKLFLKRLWIKGKQLSLKPASQLQVKHTK
jgi:hypothetical protein